MSDLYKETTWSFVNKRININIYKLDNLSILRIKIRVS